MEMDATAERFREALLGVMDETFENVHLYFLDKNTSLLETLDTISAAEASLPVSENGASIAGHVNHLRFNMARVLDIAQGNDVSNADWRESWVVKEVTQEQWAALKAGMREVYQGMLALAKAERAWETQGRMWGAMAMVAHAAYHLGAIRMAVGTIRQRTG